MTYYKDIPFCPTKCKNTKCIHNQIYINQEEIKEDTIILWWITSPKECVNGEVND